MQLFADAAYSAQLEGTWLVLPGDACFLGERNRGNTMYVREAYVKLAAALEQYAARGTKHIVITGNPGLGKSWFAIYMLIRCTSAALQRFVPVAGAFALELYLAV